MKSLLMMLLVKQILTLKYITCPELTTQGASACGNQDNCLFYEWYNAGNACFYDCSYYQQAQDQCMLLFNCKWLNGVCLHKQCLDYTNQGCRWHWNKCRQSDCSQLAATDISHCSRTFCKWDETKRTCTDNVCGDYTSQSVCEGIFECTWSHNKCTQQQAVAMWAQIVSCFVILMLLPKSVIAQMSEIVGNVKFGNGCFVHPGCSIIAEGGDIIFGDYNIIEERVVIKNQKLADGTPKPMIIGNYNLFEISSRVENSNIGNHNTLEQKTLVENSCEIGDCCRIGAASKVPTKSVIANNTKIHYPFNIIMDSNFEVDTHKQHIELLFDALVGLQAKAKSSSSQKK